jgi:hypothetical protein
MAFASAALAGDHQVVVPAYEVEKRELQDEGFVETRLEVPVEGFQHFAFDEAARIDPS